jgi:hypothetical protein
MIFTGHLGSVVGRHLDLQLHLIGSVHTLRV